MPHDPHAELAALRRNIELVDRSIALRMKAAYGRSQTIAQRLEPANSRCRTFGRATTAWTKRAEARFRVAYVRVLRREEKSLRALVARRHRLVAAEASLRARLRLNEAWCSRHYVYPCEAVALLEGNLPEWLLEPIPY